MSESQIRDLLLRRAAAAALTLDDHLLDRLQTYFQLLARWNARINLTGFSLDQPTGSAVDRLIVEPLLLAQVVKHPVGVWFDLGSGGGSPAVPLQLYQPAERLVLVESKGRKAAFLREVVRQMCLERVEIECARIESVALRHPLSGTAGLVTVRAVRPSEAVLASIQALLRKGGQAVLIGSKSDQFVGPAFEVVPAAEFSTRYSFLLLSKV